MYVPAILFLSALLPTLSLKGGELEWFTSTFANIELESKRRFVIEKGTLSHTIRGVDFHLMCMHVCMSDYKCTSKRKNLQFQSGI